MKTTTNTKATLSSTIENTYGVSEIEADAVVVEWAATKLADKVGVDAAAKAWKRLNAKRTRMGRHTTIPQWGTPFFAAYFAK